MRLLLVGCFFSFALSISAQAGVDPDDFNKQLDRADQLGTECVRQKKNCSQYLALKSSLQAQGLDPKTAERLSPISLCRAGVESACQQLQMMQQNFRPSQPIQSGPKRK